MVGMLLEMCMGYVFVGAPLHTELLLLRLADVGVCEQVGVRQTD